MRPVEVTEDQIIDAGNQLVTEGRAVTANALRNKVGAGNPRRLIGVWKRLSANSMARIQGAPESEVAGHAVVLLVEAGPTHIDSKAGDLRYQLTEARRLLECEQQRVAQLEITINAVTDQLNDYKQRCVRYETSAKHTETRIADLTARIDEQRGELHRGSQARIALEQALHQIQSSLQPPNNLVSSR